MSYVNRGSYPNPPIDEALLHFGFSQPLPWNVTTPGRIYELIKSKYDGEPESQEQLNATFEATPGSEGANLALNRGQLRVIYRSGDRSKFAICEPSSLTVGSNRPYDGWPSIRERMDWVWEALCEVWNFPSIGKISTRYINRVVIPESVFDTDAYFAIPVRTAERGSWSFSGFVNRVESARDAQTRAVLTFASIKSDPQAGSEFLLDLEFQHYGEVSTFSDAKGIADDLKNLENSEFEDCITDKTRELFK